MSSLHDPARLFHNPRALLAHWSAPPFAEPVEIHELNLLRDGPLLRARVEVFEQPVRRSPRWDPSANAWQVTLAFWSVTELRLSDWTTSNCERLEITPSGPDLHVRFGAALSFRCSTVRVEGVSAYRTPELWLDGRPGAHPTWLYDGPAPREVDPAELGLPTELLAEVRAWAAARDSADEPQRAALDEAGRRLASALFEVVGSTHRVAYRSPQRWTRWG